MDAETLGLAAYVMLAQVLNELETTHPGIKERAKANSLASFADPTEGNAPKIIEAIRHFN